MSGWDEGGVFYSDPIPGGNNRENQASDAKRLFYDFIRNFRDNNAYTYRDQLRRHYNLNTDFLEVELDDLIAFNADLANKLQTQPSEFMPMFELAAKEAADTITYPRDNEEKVRPIQITLRSQANPLPVRMLGAAQVSKMIKVSGIVISASSTRAKATNLTIQCRNCRTTKEMPVKPGLNGSTLPRTCDRIPVDAEEERCPIDPYIILPDKCMCVDQQTLKLQELPEMVPTGEMPRHMLLSVDRYLVDRVTAGTRCTVMGIYSIFNASKRGSGSPVRNPYLQVTGIDTKNSGPGRNKATFTPEEEEEMLQFSRDPDIYNRIWRSFAPSIYGGENIKKAISCLLFGGSAKELPDQTHLRGDINVLLLGDPGTAKSQLLKFAEKVAPIAVYTSGKGSSAAGLTASVVRDAGSREFHLEGGAMVLADGGIVCIDEFDKMRETDRVAIHEAMEQQTISIAKAGITTTLNSRTSVLAAANSAFGRWDDTKDADENIDFQSAILSRFDLIFIVKDEHNPERDATLAKFVMNVHLKAAEASTDAEGEVSTDFLKKYIQYCRTKCGPRLGESAAEKLKDHFVKIRGDTKKIEQETGKRTTIPITVRQLEALVRLTESLAKMRMMPFASEEHVEEALRLFKTSTMDAASNNSLGDSVGDAADLDTMLSIEQNLKRRFPVGSRVSESRIVQEFTKQNYTETSVKKVLAIMLRRGEVEHQMQRRVLYRVK